MPDASGPSLSRGKRILFTLVLAALVLGACELASRLYWARTTGRPFRDPDLLLHAWYPELHRLDGEPAARGDDRFDVLVLGPSVLEHHYGTFDEVFEAALRARHPNMAVFNLSRAGHSVLDGLNKYRVLGRHRFDLVFVYGSINEIRANNVPPGRFRDDYSHVDWYWEANAVVAHPWLARRLTLPFGLRRAWLLAEESADLREPVPRVHPDPDWLPHGREIKTTGPLRAQLEEIRALARERGDPLLLATFAWWLPPDYSLERFQAHELDYAFGKKATPIEVWGTPENVAAGLALHNQVIEAVARAAPADLFVDLAARVPPGRRNFQDVCHLTRDGIAALVDAVMEALDRAGPALAAPPPCGGQPPSLGSASRRAACGRLLSAPRSSRAPSPASRASSRSASRPPRGRRASPCPRRPRRRWCACRRATASP
jgi:hypothetical protein